MPNTVEIIVTAKDAASEVLKNVGKEGDSLGSKLKALAPAIAGVATGFLSFKAIEGAISVTQKLGGEIGKLSRETGLGAEDASRLVAVFKHFGQDGDDASRSLGIFSKNLTIAHEETLGFSTSATTMQKLFQSMGISAETAGGQMRPLNDVLLDVADKFKGMQDGAEKTGLAMQLFGKSGKDMLPILNQGRDGIAELEKAADKLGITLTSKNLATIKQYTLAHRDLNEAMSGLKLEIGLEVMPVLTKLAEWFTDHQPQIRKFFADVIKDVGEFSKNTQEGLKIVADALQWIPDNKGIIVAAIVLIGAQMAISFGPESIVVAGLLLILSLLGKVKRESEGASKLPGLYQQQTDLESQLSKQGVGNYTGLPPVLPQPGSQADNARQARIGGLQGQLADVNAQIAHFEEVESNAGKTAEIAAPPIARVADGLSALPAAADKAKDKLKEVMDAWNEKLESALEDGTASFKEFTELNKDLLKISQDLGSAYVPLTAAEIGHLEAVQALASVTSKTDEQAYNFVTTMTKLVEVFKTSTSAAKDLIFTMGQETLAKLQSAASSITGRPTQEQARLQLELATANLRVAGFSASGATDEQLAQQRALVDNIGKQIAVETARTQLYEAQITQADQTLLTNKEQEQAIRELIPAIRDQTLYLRTNTDDWRVFVPEFRDGMQAFRDFWNTLRSFNASNDIRAAARGVA